MLSQPDAFTRIPEDWYVVITDIKNSTRAVESGLHEVVNLVATGSIIAALNIAAKTNTDLPFFFGGDGATLLVPPTLLAEITAALVLHQRNIKTEFNLDLRVGSVAVAEVYAGQYELKIAKVSINQLYAIPIVLGSGLQFAEKVVKSRDILLPQEGKPAGRLDLAGMECRWNKVPPPENTDEVVCLLISAMEESAQAAVYKHILDEAEAIYGAHHTRNPISLVRLQLSVSVRKLRTELRVRHPRFWMLELLIDWVTVWIGRYFYLPSKTGQRYLNELVQLSDIFVLDGRINMIISGQSTQRDQLTALLDELERKGDIVYGIYVSRESIISCYVRNRVAQHIHFVDGGDGGYTKAATVLKEKMSRRRNN